MRSKIYLFALLLLACHENVEEISIDPPPENFVSFSTSEQFFSTVDKIATMTEKELDAWEKANNFQSYRSVLRKAEQEWASMTDINQVQPFLEKYIDILTIQDDAISPRIKVGIYQAVINRAGIYETAEYLNKIVYSNIYSAARANAELLDMIQSEDPCIPEFPSRLAQRGLFVSQYTESEHLCEPWEPEPWPEDPPIPLPNPCSTWESDSYFDNNSKCSDDREVIILARSYILTSHSSEGTYRQPRVEIEVTGHIRNWLCKWYSYKTPLWYRNVSFELMAWTVQNFVAIPTSFSVSIPDYYQAGEYVSLDWDQPIGHRVLNQSITANPFTRLHAEGKSRGTDGWAVIDCE